MVVPSFSTLFADSPVQMLGDLGPFLGTVTMHQLDHQVVLLHNSNKRDE